MKTKHFCWWIPVLVLSLFLAGCHKAGPEPIIDQGLKNKFDNAIGRTIDTIIGKEKLSAVALSPVAVFPGALKSGGVYTRLEEVIMERLSRRLSKNHEVIRLSRENWFEYREGRPLSAGVHGGYDPSIIKNLLLYRVNVSADSILEELRISIAGYRADGRIINGLSAGTTLDFRPGRVARILYETPAQANPFPIGMEENPYASVDRLCFSLASELTDAYRTGITAGNRHVGDEEIKVLLYLNPIGGVAPRTVAAIGSGLQQAIVADRGFTCVISQADFGPAFKQIDFYKKNFSTFSIEDPKFLAGTVLLMADVFPHPSGRKTGIALRAIWRVSPLSDKNGAFVPDETAGTYISGFTARAYLSGGVFTGASPGVNSGASLKTAGAPSSGNSVRVWFYHVPKNRMATVEAALRTAAGVELVAIDTALCEDARTCMAYEIQCRCSAFDLAWTLEKSFAGIKGLILDRMAPESDTTLRIYFRGVDDEHESNSGEGNDWPERRKSSMGGC
ncbi:MAG: hypothetical protein GXP53_06675 [Deltaproteobacteria bacterium]|nr:hypothetical protein [Deltaproteobacteria bacterium]